MNKLTINAAILFLFAVSISTATFAQTPDTVVKPSVISGEATKIEPSSIAISTKDGELNVVLSEKTAYKKVVPDNPSLQSAVAATLQDIGQGDRLVITGILAPDKKTFTAKSVYLMTKADIAQRDAKDSEAWKTRGMTGRVVSVDPVAKNIGVEIRSLAGNSTITLTPKDSAKFLRYAPDSVKFSEAKPSSIIDIQKGDMLRALGDKGPDGTTFTAEEVVTGAFQTVAGTVKSIDPAKNEVVITNLQTKKDMTVAIGPSSILKRFPEEMATRMAAFQNGQSGVRPLGQGGGTPPQQGTPPAGQGRAGFGSGRGAAGIDDMLDRFPTITAADLKPGDVIAVSSTKNGDLDRITAIKLLAGVEPFLRAAQASGRQTGRGGNSNLGNFEIPGLDGFGAP